MKNRYPNSIFTATLGENQDTSKIEFKNPNGNSVLSDNQSKMLKRYESNGCKTLVSNDYDYIIEKFDRILQRSWNKVLILFKKIY